MSASPAAMKVRKNAPQLQVTLQKILPKRKCSNHPKLKEFLFDSEQHICAYLSVTKSGRTDACEVSNDCSILLDDISLHILHSAHISLNSFDYLRFNCPQLWAGRRQKEKRETSECLQNFPRIFFFCFNDNGIANVLIRTWIMRLYLVRVGGANVSK